ncbi:MAG: hypothetical protein GMKNLPBB_00002 [Myxococcota bacterium]|nr:hypothetical protein [Myxococcota bacterium]
MRQCFREFLPPLSGLNPEGTPESTMYPIPFREPRSQRVVQGLTFTMRDAQSMTCFTMFFPQSVFPIPNSSSGVPPPPAFSRGRPRPARGRNAPAPPPHPPTAARGGPRSRCPARGACPNGSAVAVRRDGSAGGATAADASARRRRARRIIPVSFVVGAGGGCRRRADGARSGGRKCRGPRGRRRRR